MTVLRIGTRASALATTQSGLVADLVREHLGRECELVEVTTEGDRSAESLATIGGTGVFVYRSSTNTTPGGAMLPVSFRVRLICTLGDPRVPDLAASLGTTRSAAAMELWREHLPGSIVAVGNAPTALFRLLELLDAGVPPPAAVIGIPVGFVGAAESKAELARDPRGTAFVTLRGRRGGSAMAAAAVNALGREP